MIESQGSGVRFKARERTKRNLWPVGRMNIDALEGVGILLELRVHFQDNVVLIQLRVNRGDLALSEGVVESVVDVGGKNSQTRSRIAVDHNVEQQTTT